MSETVEAEGPTPGPHAGVPSVQPRDTGWAPAILCAVLVPAPLGLAIALSAIWSSGAVIVVAQPARYTGAVYAAAVLLAAPSLWWWAARRMREQTARVTSTAERAARFATLPQQLSLTLAAGAAAAAVVVLVHVWLGAVAVGALALVPSEYFPLLTALTFATPLPLFISVPALLGLAVTLPIVNLWIVYGRSTRHGEALALAGGATRARRLVIVSRVLNMSVWAVGGIALVVWPW
jgi:hypothetical protein